ncbi:uncharacterized protein Fcp3C [Diabrotica undecimpunctata]|uniref:uncharacterized protein Fcp3C n=1 Tax=Diabrotica undecimpunctata TaxID=50387 RepID=UPI003B636141
MKKLRLVIIICIFCNMKLDASLLKPSIVFNHNDLERKANEKDAINEALEKIIPVHNSTVPMQSTTETTQCEPKEQVEPKPRIADEKSSQQDDESNEIYSKERRPSLVERLIHHKEIKDDKDNGHGGRDPIPCTCGVFLSGQFKKGSKKQPKGLPVLTQEMDTPFMNNAVGNRQCTNKCLELIIKHLPKSSEIICATVDREHVFKERAYLFIKNHSDKWHGTNLSAGREFCCKDNIPYKCPVS